jgi:putative FmdB family regulatory protein
MPIYEYRCDACGHELEALQKLSDPRLTECPACAADSLRRLISKPSFRLKGSGWYETDFKSDKDKQRNLATGKDEKSKSTDDKPKSSDDKPAAKEAKEAKEVKASDAKTASGKKDSGTAAA